MSLLDDLTHDWSIVTAPTYEDWKVARHGLLTASKVAEVMGLSKYGTFERNVREKQLPFKDGGFVSSAMEAGTHMESCAFNWFMADAVKVAERRGEPMPEGRILRNEFGTSLLVSHPDPALRLAASPDGLVVFDGVPYMVEIKVTNPKTWFEVWDGPGEAIPKRWGLYDTNPPPSAGRCPLRHWVQLQTQMLCTGVQQGFVVGVSGTARKVHKFAADERFQLAIERASSIFWKAVDGDREEGT